MTGTERLRLSPRQIEQLAAFICGGDGVWEYRRMVDILGFMRFTGAPIPAEPEPGSRFYSARAFVEHVESSEAIGASGLTRDTERLLIALLDRREFDSDENHAGAIQDVTTALKGIPVRISVGPWGVEVTSTRRGRAQQLLEETIHAQYGGTLSESDLSAARAHYKKARTFLEARNPDYENSCKESVCSLEAVAVSLTGKRDLMEAVRWAAQNGLVARPLDEMIVKLFAFRGNEPGVAHGGAKAPAVRRSEAELLFNLTAAIGSYLRNVLTTDGDGDPNSP